MWRQGEALEELDRIRVQWRTLEKSLEGLALDATIPSGCVVSELKAMSRELARLTYKVDEVVKVIRTHYTRGTPKGTSTISTKAR